MGLIFWKQVLAGGDVGGRATDLGQIGLSLIRAANEHYGSREPPVEVKAQMARLARRLEGAEQEILEFARVMLSEVSKDA